MSLGVFVTFEGLDGSGKTTAANRLAAYLEGAGHSVERTREPGGSNFGEYMRHRIAGMDLCPKKETTRLVYELLRLEHVYSLIVPLIHSVDWVICDRFTDSTNAYQEPPAAGALNFKTKLIPDITFFMDAPWDVLRSRLEARATWDETVSEDRNRVIYNRYRKIIDKSNGRIIKIDSSGTIEDTLAQIKTVLVQKGFLNE